MKTEHRTSNIEHRTLNGEPETRFTAREREIEMLHASVAKTQAGLQMARLAVMQLESKLVNKLADLRLKTLMLKRAQDFAAYQQRLAATPAGEKL